MNLPQKDLTIDDIKGSWEGIFPLFISYCRLEIDPEGNGYFIVVYKEDDVEVLKIKSISIDGKEIEIRFDEIESTIDEFLIMKGVVWFDRIYLEVEPDKQTENQNGKMSILLMRDDAFNSYREIAIEKIGQFNN